MDIVCVGTGRKQWMSLSQITGDLSVQSIIDVMEQTMGFLSFTIV